MESNNYKEELLNTNIHNNKPSNLELFRSLVNSRADQMPRSSLPATVKEIPSNGQLLADRYAMESGLMECSILASDCMARAQEVYDSLINRASPLITLYSPEEDFSGSNYQGFSKVINTDKITGYPITTRKSTASLGFRDTDNGHVFSIGLLKQEDKTGENEGLGIYAITRQNLVFPIVKFVRSTGSYCDYLQFYGENPEDELQSENLYGWGKDDNGSRFSAVAEIKELVNSIVSGSKISQDKVDKYFILFNQLGLFKRFEKELGISSIENENFINAILTKIGPNFDLELQKQYEVSIGKVTTNLTSNVKIKPGEDRQFNRVITKSEFPTNMPNEVRELLITVDKRTGILVVDSEGNERSFTNTDMNAVIDVVENGTLVSLKRNNLKGLKKIIQKFKTKKS